MLASELFQLTFNLTAAIWLMPNVSPATGSPPLVYHRAGVSKTITERTASLLTLGYLNSFSPLRTPSNLYLPFTYPMIPVISAHTPSPRTCWSLNWTLETCPRAPFIYHPRHAFIWAPVVFPRVAMLKPTMYVFYIGLSPHKKAAFQPLKCLACKK